MSRALSVVLAVCCALSMGLAAVPATDTSTSPVATAPAQSATCTDDPNVGCVANSSNYLSLNATDVVTVSQNDTALDVSSAVATDVEATSSAFSAEAFENAYRAAPRDDRRAVVERYGNALENRTEDLRDREREALEAFNDGDISGDEYLRTLAEIDAKADRLWALSVEVRNRWRSVTGQYSRDPYAGIRGDLYGLRGPIRDHVQSVYAGTRTSTRVHVTTTDDGVTLAAFVRTNGQQTYVRDTYLGDVRRASSGSDRYGGDALQAQNRIKELYPWAFTQSTDDTRGFAGAYQSTGIHAYGRTTVFLDGESGHVFAEHQLTYLDRTPTTTTTETNASNGLSITLGQTHQGGPLNVTVTDETGARVPATVTVNGRTVGETGDDGTLWTTMPYTSNFVVRAEHDGETVTIVRFARS